MLIILEGADAVGKTTVADQLVNAARLSGVAPVIRLAAGPPAAGRSAIEIYEQDLLIYRNSIMDPDSLVIADRWHLGELVYGPLLRNHSLLDTAALDHVELMLDALGATRIIVTVNNVADLETRYWARGGDALVTLPQTTAINQWYVYWQASSEQNVARWKLVHSPVNDEMVELLLKVARARSEFVGRLVRHPTYVGPPLPRALFVGDVPNGWEQGDPPQLAFVPGGGNSATYLLSAMHQGSVHEVGLVNSMDADVGELWVDLDTPHVLALGKRAAARLLRAGVPYDLTNHPQWQRRFRHGELDRYVKTLAQHATHYPRSTGRGITRT
jgi:hypothetical protein